MKCCSGLALAIGLCLVSTALGQGFPGTFLVPNEEEKKLVGDWKITGGTHAGKALTNEQLAKIKFFNTGGYGMEFGPLIPKGTWATSYAFHLNPSGNGVRFGRTIGLKGVSYYGTYEVKKDTLTVSVQLLPWERTTGDPSYAPNGQGGFKPDTVLTFARPGQNGRGVRAILGAMGGNSLTADAGEPYRGKWFSPHTRPKGQVDGTTQWELEIGLPGKPDTVRLLWRLWCGNNSIGSDYSYIGKLIGTETRDKKQYLILAGDKDTRHEIEFAVEKETLLLKGKIKGVDVTHEWTRK